MAMIVVILAITLAFVSMPMAAQEYVGGGVSILRSWEDFETDYSGGPPIRIKPISVFGAELHYSRSFGSVKGEVRVSYLGHGSRGGSYITGLYLGQDEEERRHFTSLCFGTLIGWDVEAFDQFGAAIYIGPQVGRVLSKERTYYYNHIAGRKAANLSVENVRDYFVSLLGGLGVWWELSQSLKVKASGEFIYGVSSLTRGGLSGVAGIDFYPRMTGLNISAEWLL